MFAQGYPRGHLKQSGRYEAKSAKKSFSSLLAAKDEKGAPGFGGIVLGCDGFAVE
jgi:hypothetical protein